MKVLHKGVGLMCAALLLPALQSCSSPGGAPQGYRADTQTHQRARAAAAREMATRLDAMTPAGTLLGQSRYDACFEYQSNWKIRDPYRIECHLHLTRAVSVDHVAEGIRETARRFAAAGCANPGAFDDSLGYYLSANGAGSNDRYRRPTDLPPVLFDCGDGTRVQAQFINPDADMLEQDFANVDAMIGARRVVLVDQQGYAANAIAAARATPAPLIVLVALDRRYHAEAW